MPALRNRLSRLRELGLVRATEIGSPPVRAIDEPDSQFLTGWEKIASHVFARTVESSFSLAAPDRDFDARALGKKVFQPGDSVGDEVRGIFDGLSFFDFETTGLSGGTGTVGFLAAIGYFEYGLFHVSQVFMDDFPGERALLEYVLAALRVRPTAVTYNGAAFDMPLLRTRCILNALPLPGLGHIDVLHAARRLWRRAYGSCSLQAMEANVLGEPRGEDVPGSLIPALWLDYSGNKTGRDYPSVRFGGLTPFEMMRRIAEHNAKDVISLARLMLDIADIYDAPIANAGHKNADRVRLAKDLATLGRFSEADELLEEASAEGDCRASICMARRRKKAGMLEEYVKIVEAMPARTVEACVEKSKCREHILKDPVVALDMALRGLALAREAQAEPGRKSFRRIEELQFRIRRLEAKVERHEAYRRADRRLP